MTPADRLAALLPVLYQWRDADGSLRALLGILGEQVEAVEADIERLYDSFFVETADPWALPYLGDLLGWVPVPEAGALVTRRDVANTLRQRRRKGTLVVLEDLAADVAGWPAVAVEMARLLARAQAVNHVHHDRGRSVDLRDVDVLERVDGPFDELAHTVDVRRPSSGRSTGRHNLPAVVVFAWRLEALPVTGCPAYLAEQAGRHCFTFSILGNDAPLFTRPDGTRGETGVPGPIRRLGMGERAAGEPLSAMRASPAYYGEDRSLVLYAPGWPESGAAQPVPADRVVPADLSGWRYRPARGTVAVDPVLGRIMFPSRQPPRDGVRVLYHYGTSAGIGGGEYERRRPPIAATDDAPVWRATVTTTTELREALARWREEAPQRAVVELDASDVFSTAIELDLGPGQELHLRSAPRRRPVLWLLDRDASRPDAMEVRLGPRAALTLEGLLVTGRAVRVEGVPGDDPTGEETPDGPEGPDGPDETPDGETPDGETPGEPACPDTRRLEVRHCTLVPGWTLHHDCSPASPQEPSLELVDLGGACVVVASSITGPVEVAAEADAARPVAIEVTDSIVDATATERLAVRAPGGGHAHAELTLARTTVFGGVLVHAVVLVENSIVTGRLAVARRQQGCVRYSVLGDGSRTPRRVACPPNEPTFTSRRYGRPGYAQLSLTAPEAVRRGADDESEMGAFHSLHQPQRVAGLRARLADHTVAAMEAGLVFVT